jgi:DNA-binding MarR family transcriptional regulator
MSRESILANQAWEAYYRAQAALSREFTEADIWNELGTKEYAVLHALSNEPAGLRITELGDDVLLTQPGMSRLVARLEERGLVERGDDSADARARRIRLTADGVALQKKVGRRLADQITGAMTRALTPTQMEVLRDLSLAVLAGTPGTAATVQQAKFERNYS